MRLSFSTMTEERLTTGIARLGAAISKQMQSAR
jgi:DNA-binding transcriptional MocR family regulator